MYFQISQSEQLKWDGNDNNWYKPPKSSSIRENFSFGQFETGDNTWLYIILIIALACGLYYYYLYKKTPTQ